MKSIKPWFDPYDFSNNQDVSNFFALIEKHGVTGLENIITAGAKNDGFAGLFLSYLR